jgi:hypothetical protein
MDISWTALRVEGDNLDQIKIEGCKPNSMTSLGVYYGLRASSVSDRLCRVRGVFTRSMRPALLCFAPREIPPVIGASPGQRPVLHTRDPVALSRSRFHPDPVYSLECGLMLNKCRGLFSKMWCPTFLLGSKGVGTFHVYPFFFITSCFFPSICGSPSHLSLSFHL